MKVRRNLPHEPCPVAGCAHAKLRTWLMCRECWNSLPPADRRAHQNLYRTWRSLRHSTSDQALHAALALQASCAAKIAQAAEIRVKP